MVRAKQGQQLGPRTFCSKSNCVSKAKHMVRGAAVCSRHYISSATTKRRPRRELEPDDGGSNDDAPDEDTPDSAVLADWLGQFERQAEALHHHGISVEALVNRVTAGCASGASPKGRRRWVATIDAAQKQEERAQKQEEHRARVVSARRDRQLGYHTNQPLSRDFARSPSPSRLSVRSTLTPTGSARSARSARSSKSGSSHGHSARAHSGRRQNSLRVDDGSVLNAVLHASPTVEGSPQWN